MSTPTPGPSRRGFIGGSMLFVGGSVAATSCNTDPLADDSNTGDAEIVLQHWYHEYGEEGTHEAVIRYSEEYTAENPDVAIEVTWLPGDYESQWRSAIVGGEGPDVYEVNEVGPDMVEQEQVTPLTDVFGAELDDFDPVVLEEYTHDGEIYAVPMVIDLMHMYYRTSMLEDAGIDPPQTIPELFEAAQELASGDTKGLFVSNDGFGHLRMLVPLVNGAQLLDGRTVAINSDETIEVLEAMRELWESNALLLDYATDWWDPTAFTSGATAMAYGGMWALPQIQEALGDDFQVAPLPPFRSGERSLVNLGGWVQVVNGQSPNIEAAKDYVRWLWVDRTDIQEDWNVGYGFHLPPRVSAAENTSELQSGPAADSVAIAAEHGWKQPNLWTPQVRTPYEDAADLIIKEGADPEETLATAVEECQAELDALPEL